MCVWRVCVVVFFLLDPPMGRVGLENWDHTFCTTCTDLVTCVTCVLVCGTRAAELPDANGALARALKVLDRTHPFETHKFGVVYVRAGQVREDS